jgi:phosphoribosyl-AMP cyclohydrolase
MTAVLIKVRAAVQSRVLGLGWIKGWTSGGQRRVSEVNVDGFVKQLEGMLSISMGDER